MKANESEPQAVERLWQTARFLPQSVRLLGTRYRPLFLAHARECEPGGDNAAVADALCFVLFMNRQNRVALMAPELRALRRDARALKRRFWLRRKGREISVAEKWKVLQWLGV